MEAEISDDKLHRDKHKKLLQENFALELKKKEQQWLAAEKQRRQKWERDREATIRQQCYKGLEPEIQKIIEKSKDDLRRNDEKHEAVLRQVKRELQEQHHAELRECKEKLGEHTQNVLEVERQRNLVKL